METENIPANTENNTAEKARLDRQISFMRLMLWLSPAILFIAAIAVYIYWDNPNKLMVCGLIVMAGCIDYYTFRYIIVKLQQSRAQL